MDKNQKINCTVESCAYNDSDNQECELDEIVVEPNNDATTGEAEEESMCGSYEETEEDSEE